MNNIAVKTPPATKTLCVLTLLIPFIASDFISAAAEMHVRRYDPAKTKKLEELFITTHHGTWAKHSEEMALLVEGNADPDVQRNNDSLLINQAVLYNSIHLVNTLLAHNANVNTADYFGNTALFFVKSSAMIHTLVQGGADIHHCARDGKNALTQAVAQARGIEILHTLLEYGLNPNQALHNGVTPFHLFCERSLGLGVNRTSGIKLFLLAGGLLDTKDKSNKTPRENLQEAWLPKHNSLAKVHDFEKIDQYARTIAELNKSDAVLAYHEDLKTLMTFHFNYPTIIAQLTTSYLSPLSIMQALMNWNEKQEKEKKEHLKHYTSVLSSLQNPYEVMVLDVSQ